MECDTQQMRSDGSYPPTPGQLDTNLCGSQATYWGVLCRTCDDLVAFDASPYGSFGPGAANMKPGAIRCAGGHNHIYFSRDFRFVSWGYVPEEVMQQNRDAFRAINPASPNSAASSYGERPNSESFEEIEARTGAKKRVASQLADPRREGARAAGKEYWSSWAEKKAM
jgi:hypothetical protein